MKVINYIALKKNRGQNLQAKCRRKKPQTQFQKHQIQEIFELFLLIVEVYRVLEEVKKFHVDPSGNVKEAVQKLNFAWIKFCGWPHFSVFRVDLISRFLSKTAKTAKCYPREI